MAAAWIFQDDKQDITTLGRPPSITRPAFGTTSTTSEALGRYGSE
jgi:hypothetical protein